jgi:hypothetical protein
MGAAHRSEHRRAQAIEDRFEALRARRLALNAALGITVPLSLLGRADEVIE